MIQLADGFELIDDEEDEKPISIADGFESIDINLADGFEPIDDVIESPNRNAVLQDFGNIDTDMAQGFSKEDAKRGRVASYIASSGSVDMGLAIENAEVLGAGLIGKEGAGIADVFSTIQRETDVGDSEQAMKDLMEAEWVMGADDIIPFNTITPEDRATLLQNENLPSNRAFEAAGRAYTVDWAEEKLGIPQRTQPEGAMEWIEEIVGTVAGTIASYVTGAKLLQTIGGVGAVPQVSSGLSKLAQYSPRAARMTERAMNTFIVLGGRSQIHSSSKDLQERAKMLKTDAIVSVAFPVADWLSEIPRVGIPAAATAMFAAGTTTGDTWDEKLIGGTSLTLMWGASYGANYSQATKMATETARAAGVKDPEAFVSSLNRTDILKGAQNIKDQMYVRGMMREAAQGAKAKYDSGQKLLGYEKMAVAEANKNNATALAKVGEIAPIKADRAALQASAVVEGILNPKTIEPTATESKEQGDLIVKYTEEAESLGIEFRGFFDGETPIPDFFDPEHGGNFSIEQGESLEAARDRKRAQFKAGETSDAIAKSEVVGEQTEIPLTHDQIVVQTDFYVTRDMRDFDLPPEKVVETATLAPKGNQEDALLYEAENIPALYEPPPNWNDLSLDTPEGDDFINKTSKIMQRSAESMAGFFRRFGRQYVSDKPLANKMEDVYHEIAAAPHRGVLEIHEELKKFPRTSAKDRVALTVALESSDRMSLPTRLLSLYDKAEELMQNAEGIQLRAGVLAQSFEEGHQSRISDLSRRISEAKGGNVAELVAEKRRLEEIKSYLPHNVVARRVMEEKMNNSPVGAKRTFGKKLSQFHKQRKGTHSIAEYIEQGIISESDADITKMLMSTYVDTYHKVAVRGFIEWGTDAGYIIPQDQEVDDPGNWFIEDEIHPIARVGGMEGMKIDRLFAQGFEEMGGKGKMAYNAFDKILGITKVNQFINPAIIWRHNISQAVLGGSTTVNPLKLAGRVKKAYSAVTTKNELWKEFDRFGLYQKTDIPTRVAVDELIQQYSNKTKLYKGNEALSRAANILGQSLRITPEQVQELIKDRAFAKGLMDAIMVVPSAISSTTWLGDEFQRTMSAITLMDKNYSAQDAAQEAARIHGAYSNVGIGYKEAMRRVAFVYSFRMLMPWQYQIQPWITLANNSYKKAKGKDIPKKDKRKSKAAAWTLLATTMIPFAYDVFMKKNGWVIDEKERDSGFRKFADKMTLEIPIGQGKRADLAPNFAPHWRYTKTINTPEGKKDIVWIVGTPNMTFSRVGVRATENMPEEVKNGTIKGLWNATWAEIHPFYRQWWNFLNNEPLTYGGLPPRGLDGNDFIGGAWEMFKSTFRIYGAMAELGKIGDVDPDKTKQLLDEHLTTVEKWMTWGGFQYIRNTEDRQRIGEMFTTKENINELARTINNSNQLTDEEKKAKLQEIIALGQASIRRVMADTTLKTDNNTPQKKENHELPWWKRILNNKNK